MLICTTVITICAMMVLIACDASDQVNEDREHSVVDTSVYACEMLDEHERAKENPDTEPDNEVCTMSAADVVEAYVSGIYQNRIEYALEFLDEDSVHFSFTSIEALSGRFADYISNADFLFIDTDVESIGTINGYEAFSVFINIEFDGVKETINEGVLFTVNRGDGFKILYGGSVYFDYSLYQTHSQQALFQAEEQARLFQEMSFAAQQQAINDAQQAHNQMLWLHEQAMRDAQHAQEQAQWAAQQAQNQMLFP